MPLVPPEASRFSPLLSFSPLPCAFPPLPPLPLYVPSAFPPFGGTSLPHHKAYCGAVAWPEGPHALPHGAMDSALPTPECEGLSMPDCPAGIQSLRYKTQPLIGHEGGMQSCSGWVGSIFCRLYCITFSSHTISLGPHFFRCHSLKTITADYRTLDCLWRELPMSSSISQQCEISWFC